jgi:RNA polymerase sigma-70 factor (ECF subfamily)
MEGYSIEEAAAILGCAPGTVKSRCARGRAKLLPLLRHWQTTRGGSADVPAKAPQTAPTAATTSSGTVGTE